jgi:hypothetical protein
MRSRTPSVNVRRQHAQRYHRRRHGAGGTLDAIDPGMRFIISCAIALVLIPITARADSYITLGIGDAPGLNGGVNTMFDRDTGGHSSRIAIGQRFGIVGLEADWVGADMMRASTSEHWDSSSLGVSAKLFLPIFWRLELYGRGGLSRTWVGADDEGTRFAGNGHVLGAGLNLDLGIPSILSAALWTEYDRHSLELHDRSKVMDPIDGSFDTFMVGLSIGI